MKKTRTGRGRAVDVVSRHTDLLGIIPRLPHTRTAQQLTARLAEKGFDVTKRSVERDLIKLEEAGFGIVHNDDDKRPYAWSRLREASSQVHGLDHPTALTLKLAYAYVRHLVPASVLSDLKKLSDAANKSLEGVRNNLLARWPDKIRVLSSGPPRTPPRISPEVHLAVSEALLKNSQLRLRYPRGDETPKDRLVNPLGMVVKGGVIYLVVSGEKRHAPYNLALHRVLDAHMEYADAKPPSGWKGLDAYIDDGNVLFPLGPSEKNCQVTLRFDSIFVRNIKEMPISGDQLVKKDVKLAPDGKPYYLVRARVTVSEEFVRWLLQYGEHVEVVKPVSLRRRMRSIVANLHFRYKTV